MDGFRCNIKILYTQAFVFSSGSPPLTHGHGKTFSIIGPLDVLVGHRIGRYLWEYMIPSM